MSTVARAFDEQVICAYGPVQSLYSDLGLEFQRQDSKQAVKSLGIRQSFTCSFSPQSNGLVERFNKTLVEILHCMIYEQPLSWDSSLKLAQLAYNSSYSVALKETPHFIFL